MLHVCSVCDYNYPVGTDAPETPIGIGATQPTGYDPRYGCRVSTLPNLSGQHVGVIQASPS